MKKRFSRQELPVIAVMNAILIFLMLFSGCITYDKLYIYDKSHKIVESNLLHYNGFYNYNSDVVLNDTTCIKPALPMFFYSDGTAYTSGHFCNIDSIKVYYGKAKRFPDYDWGSYKIEGNDITVEFYWPNSGSWTYERYHMKGKINLDTITFITYIDRNSKTKPVNYKYYFESSENKPDSNLSFIKNNKRFN